MFQFLHGYLKEQFPGLIKHNMFDETSGIKFHQIWHTPPELRFNTLARKDGELYHILKECRRPFYLDRLQGGWWFLSYDFDRQLIDTYVDLLGDNFLGFQMHEWSSNMSNDWGRITRHQKKESGQYTQEEVARNTLGYTHNEEKVSWLESATAEEYATLTCPKTEEEELAQYDWLYRDRMQKTGNLLLPCDSFHMYPRKEISTGTKAIMPEIGAQIPHERMQVALTRGMARAYNRRWGLYYEPWGGHPFGCSYYKNDLVNEWGIRVRKSIGWPGCTFTPNSGSSRALQNRIYYHALFSGAEFLSEEHGTANTFYDWEDYELSPYGIVKKEFLRFAADHRTLGDVCTPVAIVIPREFEIFDLDFISHGATYLQRPVKESVREVFSRMREILIEIFGNGIRRFGNEGHCICNSRFGDLFDIVYDDIPTTSFDRYSLVLDLSGRINAMPGKIVLDGRKDDCLALLEQHLPTFLPGAMKISGNISWTLDQYEDGFLLALFNNEGILRTCANGTEALPDCNAEVCISLRDAVIEPVIGPSPVLQNGCFHTSVNAGEVSIYRIKLIHNKT